MDKQRIAILASGSGSNAVELAKHFAHSDAAEIRWVGCNRLPGEAGVFDRMRPFGLEVISFSREDLRGGAVLRELQANRIDWVVLAGFLWHIPSELIAAFPNRMVNVHPSLLPDFGGQGMYGRHVHEAVSASGRTETGMTVHFVTDGYDEGPPVFQARCSIESGEDPLSIAGKVQALEHQYLPRVVDHLIQESHV